MDRNAKKTWTKPELEELNISETLNGNFTFEFEGTKIVPGPDFFFSPSGTTPLPK